MKKRTRTIGILLILLLLSIAGAAAGDGLGLDLPVFTETESEAFTEALAVSDEQLLEKYDSAEEITDEEVDYIIESVKEVVAYLRGFSPIWRDLMAGKKEFIL